MQSHRGSVYVQGRGYRASVLVSARMDRFLSSKSGSAGGSSSSAAQPARTASANTNIACTNRVVLHSLPSVASCGQLVRVPQPQEWTQCACANLCFRCVYDGASLCDGCMPSVPGNQRLDCDCEAGCCGVIDSEATASSDEGAVKTQS